MTTVVNVRRDECDVYIGRGSIWGNPYRIGRDGGRADVIAKYARYIVKRRDLVERLEELRNMVFWG
ncbi:MAG: DUF4326 domain-containing protein [Planctomycetota bacterium]|jgi:hypothetical protein